MSDTRKRQPKGVPVGGEFAANEHDEASMGLQVDLSSLEPTDIDDNLATLYYNHFDQQMRKDTAEKRLDQELSPGNRYPSQTRRARLEEEIADAGQKIDELEAAMKPFEDEYQRRGGWDRAFLVKGNDGHVHRSMQCSTCNRNGSRTNFMWMTEYSGKSESDIVSDAGRSACTVCYPSAPGDGGAESKIVDPEYQAEKQARADERARKAAEADAKGISDPNTGDRLMVDGWHIKTAVTAEREAVERLIDVKQDGLAPTPNREYAAQRVAELDKLESALAAKRGETRAETRAYLDAKARKKFKREYDWLMKEHGVAEAPASEWSEQ